ADDGGFLRRRDRAGRRRARARAPVAGGAARARRARGRQPPRYPAALVPAVVDVPAGAGSGAPAAHPGAAGRALAATLVRVLRPAAALCALGGAATGPVRRRTL